ncbi:MAG TPA: LLM class F420-dependent oxidoreductase [Mycobacteriales bacterium]|nr:LLM class F420-dependent oxidoreductase [Mycobacteriales bacterium]
MRFTVDYPIGSAGFDRAFLDPPTMARFATLLDSLGFDAIAFTEHPAPSQKWLDSGGHESLDPLTALAFCAATTTRLRLMTHLLVLPYRNPLVAAKQIATVDVLSAGRTTIAVGGGYLRSEFAAVGVDFDERNALVDEALEVLTTVWTTEDFQYAGRHFTAVGQASRPRPAQLPHPPLWIGGNSRKARERVATFGQGWSPMLTAAQLSATTRTAAIESVEQLAAAIGDLRRLLGEQGRDPDTVDVQVQWGEASTMEGAPGERLRVLEQLASVGVTWVCLNPPRTEAERCFDQLAAYAEDVVAPAREL